MEPGPLPGPIPPPTSPENLLRAIEVIYNDTLRTADERLEAYANLLPPVDHSFLPGFVFRYGGNDFDQPPIRWEREEELELHHNLFDAQEGQQIHFLHLNLEYTPPGDLSPPVPGRENWKETFITGGALRLTAQDDTVLVALRNTRFMMAPADNRWYLVDWHEFPTPPKTWGTTKARFLTTPIPPPIGNYYVIDMSPDWSPDGQTIAYYRAAWSADGPPGIYCINVDGSNPRLILPDSTGQAGVVQGIRFSPEGTWLAAALYLDVFIVNTDTGTFNQLTHTRGNAKSPDWSPDGKWIVYERPFLRSPADSAGTYIIEISTGAERALFHNGQPVFGGTPRWSPQGEPIAFWSGHGAETLDIFSIRSDGTDLRRLTHSGNAAMAQFPRWAFGGTRIFYSWRLLIDANSRETRVMSPEGADQSTWPVYLSRSDGISPDSRQFVYPRVPRGDSLVVLFVQGIDDAAEMTLRQLTHYNPPSFPSTLTAVPRFSSYSATMEGLLDDRSVSHR